MIGGVTRGRMGGYGDKVAVMIAIEHNETRRLGRVRLADLGYTHEFTLGYSAPDKASVLPGVHLVASLLKRWLIGTLHFRVEEAHLPYYLDEYTFRFNRRNAKSRGLLFYRLLEQAVDTDPHPLKGLLKPETGIPDFT